MWRTLETKLSLGTDTLDKTASASDMRLMRCVGLRRSLRAVLASSTRWPLANTIASFQSSTRDRESTGHTAHKKQQQDQDAALGLNFELNETVPPHQLSQLIQQVTQMKTKTGGT